MAQNRAQLEAKVLELLDSVARGHAVEDDTVECESQWPEPNKVARQIAGMANAAGGSEILYLIGVDDMNGVITTPSLAVESSNWVNQVQRRFESRHSPELLDHIVVKYGTENVSALKFATDRPPYVITDQDRNEVPWRVGAGTRSATRQQLLRLLGPISRLPRIDPLWVEAAYRVHRKGGLNVEIDSYSLTIDLGLYLEPATTEPVYFPAHRLKAQLIIGDPVYGGVVDLTWRAIHRPNEHDTVRTEPGGLRVTSFGITELHLFAGDFPPHVGEPFLNLSTTVRLVIAFGVSGSETPVILDVSLPDYSAISGNERGGVKRFDRP